MNNTYKIVAMIPARLGSKRIPKKNIRYLLDKPLIQYPLEATLGNSRFESVWVNTESEQLGRIAQRLGANFHRRPDSLATDAATNRDFVYEFLLTHPCDYVVMVNTTSPLLRPNTVNAFLDYVCNNQFDTVMSVVSEKAETMFCDQPLNFSLAEKINSQLLEPVEKIVWSLTAWKRETFLSLQERGQNPIFGGDMARFIIPKDESCDLDTEEDWRIAQGILTARNMEEDKRYLEL